MEHAGQGRAQGPLGFERTPLGLHGLQNAPTGHAFKEEGKGLQDRVEQSPASLD